MSNEGSAVASAPPLPPLAEEAIDAYAAWCRLTLRPVPDPDAWQVIYAKGEGRYARVVLQSDDDDSPVALKSRPEMPLLRLLHTSRSQWTCRRLLARSETSFVPRVLAVLPRQRILAMEAVTGKTAIKLATQYKHRPAQAFRVLRRCSAWAADLHRGSLRDSSVRFGWQAGHRLRRAAALEDSFDGSSDFPAALRRARTDLAALAEVTFPAVACHGDLHMGNLLLEPGGRAWGIDFDSYGRHPAIEDLSRLVAHFAVMFGPKEPEAMIGFLDEALDTLQPWAGQSLPEADRAFRTRLLIEALVFWGEFANSASLKGGAGRPRLARATALSLALAGAA